MQGQGILKTYSMTDKDKKDLTFKELLAGQNKGLSIAEIYKRAGFKDYKEREQNFLEFDKLAESLWHLAEKQAKKLHESIDNVEKENNKWVSDNVGVNPSKKEFINYCISKYEDLDMKAFLSLNHETWVKDYLEYAQSIAERNNKIIEQNTKIPEGLTHNEFNYLKLIKQGNSIKEVAAIKNKGKEAVEKSLYRLRKKFKVSKTDDLVKKFLP
jgi:DNA-binding CsgD family transcriptional regulator